jgi:hypothetical protein
MKRIIFKIPIDECGDAVLDQIEAVNCDLVSTKDADLNKTPFSIAEKEKLIAVNPISVIKTNAEFCWWIVQRGVLVEK